MGEPPHDDNKYGAFALALAFLRLLGLLHLLHCWQQPAPSAWPPSSPWRVPSPRAWPLPAGRRSRLRPQLLVLKAIPPIAGWTLTTRRVLLGGALVQALLVHDVPRRPRQFELLRGSSATCIRAMTMKRAVPPHHLHAVAREDVELAERALVVLDDHPARVIG